MTEPDGLDVGIVAHRSRDLLRACLESLRTYAPGRPLRIVVVDNDSGDGTVEMVRAFPGVELIEAGANVGFSAATNRAIARGGAPYFLALNPDTQVRAGTLDALLDLMDADPSIGICGCRLEREDGTFDHAAKRSFPTPLGALAHFTGVGGRAGAPAKLAQYRAPGVERGTVDAVSGAFMLIRRSALEEVGNFDEGYWLYMEDLDLCYRFVRAGWIVWYEPSVAVTHVKGGSSGRSRTLRVNRAFHYGMYRFYRQHYASSHSPVVNLVVYAAIAGKLVVSATRSAVDRRLMRRAG
jgi:N-acetylglucosaminyl-diphospho-decaprenol L-rhamnosyltransferase